MYKIALVELVYKVYNDLTPPCVHHIIVKVDNKYDLRICHKVIVPRFNTDIIKHSIAHRGIVIWNAVCQHLTDITRSFKSSFNIVRGKNTLRNVTFDALSAQTVSLKEDFFF